MAESAVHMKDLAKDVTMNLKLKGVKMFCFRLWLGLQFIKIGAWISGVGIDIEDDADGS